MKINYILGRNIEDGFGICKKCNTKRYIHHQDKKEIVYACRCLESEWAVLYKDKPCKICGKNIRLPNNPTASKVQNYKEKMVCGRMYGKCYKKHMSQVKNGWNIKREDESSTELLYCQRASCPNRRKMFMRCDLKEFGGFLFCNDCVQGV